MVCLFFGELDHGNTFAAFVPAAGAVRLHQGVFFELPPYLFSQRARTFAVNYPDLFQTGDKCVVQELVHSGQGFVHGEVAEAQFAGRRWCEIIFLTHGIANTF
jgi:hypothetical protein